MQDRFTGDVGDFGKYGLLKALCGEDLSLSVVWYLVPDEEGGDGRHTGYLKPTSRHRRRFRECDPTLYDALGGIVGDGDRSVRAVRERGVLPPGTVFYEECLTFEGMPHIGERARTRRLEHREAWVRGALEAVQGCDVVFADPDNGLESGTPRHHRRGPKFAYFDELAPYLNRGQSLIVYHHLHYGASREIQIQERLQQVNERLGASYTLPYRPGAGRAFFVIPAEAHKDVLFERARCLAREDSCRSQHFTLIAPDW